MDAKEGNPTTVAALDFDERTWKVEVNGSTYGPYSLRQIRQYLQEGRVQSESLLRHDRDPQRTGTVAELLAQPPAVRESDREVPPPPTLPERTPEITQTLNRHLITEARNNDDLATGLFDVLQIIKDQKESKSESVGSSSYSVPPSSKTRGSRRKAQLEAWREPHRMAALVLMGGVGLISLLVILHLVQQSSQKLDTLATPSKPEAPHASSNKDAAVATLPASVQAKPTTSLPSSLAPIGRPTFKAPARLVMPAAPPVQPTQDANADRRDDRDDRDSRDRYDSRDPRDMDPRDARDLRDTRDLNDFRDPAAATAAGHNTNPRPPRDPRTEPRGGDPRDSQNSQDPRYPDLSRDPQYPAGTDNGAQQGFPNDPRNSRIDGQ